MFFSFFLSLGGSVGWKELIFESMSAMEIRVLNTKAKNRKQIDSHDPDEKERGRKFCADLARSLGLRP
jgi:hypothetical protein